MPGHPKPLRQSVWRLAAMLLAASSPLAAAPRSDTVDPAVGVYDAGGVDSVVSLTIERSGTFTFVLIAGSLDQRARGRWERRGDLIRFTSDPKPVPPAVVPGPVTRRADGPFLIRIVGPRGTDLQGFDFTIDFDRGEPIEGHSNGEPWAFPDGEQRQPRSISFVMPEYSLRSVALPLSREARTTATFMLEPNDFGVLDFTGLTGRVDSDLFEVCGERLRAMGAECQTFRRVAP